MLRKFISGLGFFTILCAIPSTSEAVFTGTKSMGRAGAVMASPLDALGIAYNPAGLAWTPDQLNIGGMWIRQDGSTKFSGNQFLEGTYQSHVRESTFLPEIGACVQYMQYNWTVGVAAYTRNYIKTTYKVAFPPFGTSHLGLEYELETISPAFAIKFGRYHAFGVSLDLMAQRLMVNGLENLANVTYTEHPNKFTNKGYDYSLGIGCTVGYVGEIWECTRVAFAWSPAVSMQDFKKYKGLLARKGFYHIPERFMGGISFQLFDNLIVELDAEHNAWNHIPALDHSIEELDDINHHAPFGGNDGVGLGWRDQMIWRMGVEYIYSPCLQMRAGYQYSRTPIRGTQTLFNLFAPFLIKQWMTAGLTWNTYRVGELSIFAGYGFEQHIKGKNSIPAVFGGGDLGLKENQLIISLGWTKYY